MQTKKKRKITIFFAQKFGGSKIMCTFVGFSAKGQSSLTYQMLTNREICIANLAKQKL
jgi:hypothetical protein